MAKKKCYRCRLPAAEPEHLYARGDGKRLCMPCIVLLTYEAEVVEANRRLDAWVESEGTSLGDILRRLGLQP